MRHSFVSNALRRIRQSGRPYISALSFDARVSIARAPPPPATVSCCPVRQQRSFSSSGEGWGGKEYYKLKRKTKKDNPFQILGVSSEGDTFAAVKKAFIRIAMKYHPDTAAATSIEQEEENQDIFIGARNAFEMIAEGADGLAILRSDADLLTDEELDSWFQEETGHNLPFMDPATMKEVAEMTEKIGGELDRDGGMWTLARMVTQSVKNGGDGKDILKLEAGDIRDRQINGILRRRRKR